MNNIIIYVNIVKSMFYTYIHGDVMFEQMAKVLSTMVFVQIISWIVNLGMKCVYSSEGKHFLIM